MENEKKVESVNQPVESTVNPLVAQLQEKLAIVEQRLNEMAKKASDSADEKADILWVSWSKKILDSRFTYLIIGGAVAYVVLSFFVCL